MATRYSGAGSRKETKVKGRSGSRKPRKTSSKTTHSF